MNILRLAVTLSLVIAALGVSVRSAVADDKPLAVVAASDSAKAQQAVEAFRSALARGDSTAALALLAPDVIVLEAGGVEQFAEYRSHHLGADIAFARAVPSKHSLVSVRVEGNTAWVASTSVTEGQFNGRPVNSVGAELVVLTRTGSSAPWVIRAIHWSSRRRQP